MVRGRSRREGRTIEAGGVTALLVRKRVKNLTLRVYPPDGRVEVSAPLRMPERAVVDALVARRDWIERHRRRFAAAASQGRLRLEDGERLAVLGETMVLRFVDGRVGSSATSRLGSPAPTAPAAPLLVPTPRGAGRSARLEALREILRGVARREFASEVERWSHLMGVPVPTVQVRRMTSRWGTCHVRAGKVVLNLALVTRPRRSLEYVVVHELAHLLVPDHSPRFWAVVSRRLPGWHEARAELTERPLWADPVWGRSAELDEVEEAG